MEGIFVSLKIRHREVVVRDLLTVDLVHDHALTAVQGPEGKLIF